MLRLDAQRLPRDHRRDLPLQVERRQLPVLDHVLGGRVDGGTDHDASRLSGTLQTRSRVHRVAGEHPVARAARPFLVHEHLARLHADPHRELRPALRGEPAVQLGEDRLHLDRRADGALGVVLVRPRHAEDGQDGVAHELLEEPLVATDLLGQSVERPADDGLDHLRILAFRERRRPDEVGEEGGRVLPLLATRLRLDDRARAVQAELRVVRVLTTAARDRRPWPAAYGEPEAYAYGRSSWEGRAHRLTPPSCACSSIAASSSGRELQVVQRGHVLAHLLGPARADQRGRHPRVAQRPRERHLGEALPPRLRDLVQRADAFDVLVAEMRRQQRVAARPVDARVLGHSVEVLVGQDALREGRERDAAHPLLDQRIEQLLLDPTVQHAVGGLVDQQRHLQLAHDARRLPRHAR